MALIAAYSTENAVRRLRFTESAILLEALLGLMSDTPYALQRVRADSAQRAIA